MVLPHPQIRLLPSSETAESKRLMVLQHVPVLISDNRNFRSHVLLLPGMKVPYMELSLSGTFVPWNSHSQELSFPGTFAPPSENEVELLLLTQI